VNVVGINKNFSTRFQDFLIKIPPFSWTEHSWSNKLLLLINPGCHLEKNPATALRGGRFLPYATVSMPKLEIATPLEVRQRLAMTLGAAGSEQAAVAARRTVA
jgi:hypothetical protein